MKEQLITAPSTFDSNNFVPKKVPAWKHVFDVFIILLTLPVWLPLMAALALLIFCVSDGPVLFRQERVGHCGKRFWCYKFRTMVVGCEVESHKNHLAELINGNRPMLKMDARNDRRIIRFGRFIRASGLDELPQIFNVLAGDMSLVGPRPCLPYEYQCYSDWCLERFNALPGLTGLWQVNGKNKTTFEQMMRYDIHYSRTCHPWIDIKILFKTLPVLLAQILEIGGKTKPNPQAVASASFEVKTNPPSLRVNTSRSPRLTRMS
jgi:lipopolysaccharide/colanic/teichoic acid biosynthesis glycosyltransferase